MAEKAKKAKKAERGPMGKRAFGEPAAGAAGGKRSKGQRAAAPQEALGGDAAFRGGAGFGAEAAHAHERTPAGDAAFGSEAAIEAFREQISRESARRVTAGVVTVAICELLRLDG
jgi:hypothetical protein